MNNKVFENIKRLLEKDKYLRGSDMLLIHKYWKEIDLIMDLNDGVEFLNKATPSETIRRTRQKIQEIYPYLKPQNTFKREKLEASVRNWVIKNKPQQITLPL